MAAVGAGTVVAMSGRVVVGGGLGALPERTRCPGAGQLPCASTGRLFPAGNSRASFAKARRGAVARLPSGEESKVMKSMQDVEQRRREADALGSSSSSFDDEDIARAIMVAEREAAGGAKTAVQQPPRFATLRAFGQAGADGGAGILTGGEFLGTSVFELIAANVEAAKQVKNWEVLSGRLAMLAISVALGMEVLTGNSVFKGIDFQKLEAVAALCAVATVSAGGFAFAWRAKADVVRHMAKGYRNMVESAVDSIIDGVFFDEL